MSDKRKKLEADIERLQSELETISSDLLEERGQHNQTQLPSEELIHEVKKLKWQCSDLAEQRHKLLEEWVELKEDNEALRKALTTLNDRFEQLHHKLTNMIKVTSELEKDYIRI